MSAMPIDEYATTIARAIGKVHDERDADKPEEFPSKEQAMRESSLQAACILLGQIATKLPSPVGVWSLIDLTLEAADRFFSYIQGDDDQ